MHWNGWGANGNVAGNTKLAAVLVLTTRHFLIHTGVSSSGRCYSAESSSKFQVNENLFLR